MTHDCRRRWCETPHDPEPRNRDFEMAEYIKGRTQWEKEICKHGFRRAKGSAFDCHDCAEREAA